jgi:hypothetical protein
VSGGRRTVGGKRWAVGGKHKAATDGRAFFRDGEFSIWPAGKLG